MDILYQVFNIILNKSSKYMKSSNMNRKKIENRIKFEFKAGFMKLLGSTKNQITKDENVENVPHSEITEVLKISYF